MFFFYALYVFFPLFLLLYNFLLIIHTSGHCDMRSLRVSFCRWQEWRKRLLVCRATVDCKMLNLTNLTDECNKSFCVTNSDYRITVDGQHKDKDKDQDDIGCLKSKKRLISSVFIFSSSSPLLAVYYLRYD